MNKRGQFYLAAAIVIIALIVGFSVVVNYFSQTDAPDLNKIEQELLIEIEKIQDAGISGGLSNDDINSNLESFNGNYSESFPLDINFYFVFGDEDNLVVSGYQEIEDEEEVIITGEGEDTTLVLDKKDYKKIGNGKKPKNKKIKIKTDKLEQEFDIAKGRNFHFVIYYEDKGEKHILRK